MRMITLFRASACVGALFMVGCSASSDTNGETTETNPIGGEGGSSGQGGGSTSTTTSTSTSSTDTTTTTTTSTSTTSSTTSTSTTGECDDGDTKCDGNILWGCEGGYYVEEEYCGDQVCVNSLGCVVCQPGTAYCDGDTSYVCDADGMGYTAQECDGVQGVECDDTIGFCTGECSPDMLGSSYIGCDYYPTVTINNALTNTTSFHFAVAVANTTDSDANITITQGSSTVETATVSANSVEIITLPWVTSLFSASVSAKVTDGAYRLRSDKPVTVYQYNPLEYKSGSSYSYTNDASILLPVNAWTGNYRVASRNTWVYSAWEYPGFYAITASEDDTSVTLSPSSTGGHVLSGGGVSSSGTGTITLNAGDVLQVLSDGYGSASPNVSDLTGTLVEADKPVQVIGGHKCTYVPYNTAACDHLEESIPPLETLDTSYIVTAPLISSSSVKVNMVRITATEDGTTLDYEPSVSGAPTSIANAGDYIEISKTDDDFQITANAKILVTQYMTGQDAGGSAGDPAMVVGVATSQFRTQYLFHAPTNYSSNYVNIVAPDGVDVELDGTAVTGFTDIGSTGYRVARKSLSNSGNGNHTIEASEPVGISVYGYGQWTSYWYPGGMNLTHF